MTLFETPHSTPNDREWMQIRDSLLSRIKAAEKAGDERSMETLRMDYADHMALRTKYESAGKSQLSLF